MVIGSRHTCYDQVVMMDGWNVITGLGAYLGLRIDDRATSRIASHPYGKRFLEMVRSLAYGSLGRRYGPEEVETILGALENTDFNAVTTMGETGRPASLARNVFDRSIATTGNPYGEFEVVFQEFIGRFMHSLEGIMSILGLTRESISLENTGIQEYLVELKELPCRRLGELNFGDVHQMRTKALTTKHVESLLIKYQGRALSEETVRNVVEIISRVSGYPNYFKTMDSQQKLIEARPVLLALSEMQKYKGDEREKKALLSAMSMLLFNIFPTPKLLKFVAKFEPGPEDEMLYYDHCALMALNYTLLGRLKEAEDYNRLAYHVATDDEKRAYTHMLDSCIYINRRNYDEAINMLHRCVSLTRDKRIKAIAQFYMGIIYYELGDVDMALDCFKRCRPGVEDDIDRMHVCNNIGTCAMVKGDLKTAIRAFEKVDDMGRYMCSITSKALKSVAYGNLGIVHMSMLDYERALEYFKKALVLSRDTHNQRGIANQLGNIGLALKRKLDYAMALEYFKSTLNLSYTIGYPEGVAFAFDQVEQLMALQGLYDEADAYRKEVIKRNPGISKMLKK